jgi:Pyruvate/2-oxoacid:ferredoxin oxidoreductase delta subunit
LRSPIRKSSLAFFLEGRRTPQYRIFDWLHGYAYARWPYLYIGIGTGEHPLAKNIVPFLVKVASLLRHKKEISKDHSLSRLVKGNPAQTKSEQTEPSVTFADTYHGKVVPLANATQLVMVQEDIRIDDLENIIPYSKARAIIINHPDHIVALECPCRSSRARPCLPLDVCLIVGEPFASFVIEHHARRSRWISSQEAIAILQAEDERGHVHHAFFKDAMLGRFYAICNCCACCCGAMQAHRNGTPMLAASGYQARVNETLCLGCGECQVYCQFGALAIVDGHSQVDQVKCMGCGVCTSKCPNAALQLQPAPEKGFPLELHRLLATLPAG